MRDEQTCKVGRQNMIHDSHHRTDNYEDGKYDNADYDDEYDEYDDDDDDGDDDDDDNFLI